MSASDEEEHLRGRVERSVAAMPGPDPARLAQIRRGLGVARVRRTSRLWIAVALALGAGAGATAAWFAGPPSDATGRGVDDSAATASPEAEGTGPRTSAQGEGGRVASDPDDGEPDGDDDSPIIYRQ